MHTHKSLHILLLSHVHFLNQLNVIICSVWSTSKDTAAKPLPVVAYSDVLSCASTRDDRHVEPTSYYLSPKINLLPSEDATDWPLRSFLALGGRRGFSFCLLLFLEAERSLGPSDFTSIIRGTHFCLFPVFKWHVEETPLKGRTNPRTVSDDVILFIRSYIYQMNILITTMLFVFRNSISVS